MRIKWKLLVIVLIVAVLLSSVSWALTPIGIPAATLKQDQFAAGFSFSHTKMDVEVSALGFTATSEDNEVDTYMANLVFGAHENWEFLIDLGVSSSEYDDGSSSNGDFAGGFGVRTTWFQEDKFKLGSVVTVHFYEASTSGFDYGVSWQETDKWTEVQIAVGPSYDFGRGRLYGGPFLHIIDGTGDYSENGFSFSGDIEQEDMFGGFVGANIDVGEQATLGIEYQMTGSANAFALSVLWKF